MALIAHYKFEDNWIDVTGNYNATPSAGGTSFAAGKYGKAASFDGSGYASQPTITLATTYSVMAWVKPSSISGSHSMAAFRTNGTPIYYQFDLNGAQPRMIVRDNAGHIATAASSVNVNTSDWWHLCGVRNGNDVAIYVNGTQRGTGNAAIGAITATAPFIGKQFNGEAFAGLIDDLRIYNSDESANIAAIMNDAGAKAHIYICCQGGD